MEAIRNLLEAVVNYATQDGVAQTENHAKVNQAFAEFQKTYGEEFTRKYRYLGHLDGCLSSLAFGKDKDVWAGFLREATEFCPNAYEILREASPFPSKPEILEVTYWSDGKSIHVFNNPEIQDFLDKYLIQKIKQRYRQDRRTFSTHYVVLDAKSLDEVFDKMEVI